MPLFTLVVITDYHLCASLRQKERHSVNVTDLPSLPQICLWFQVMQHAPFPGFDFNYK